MRNIFAWIKGAFLLIGVILIFMTWWSSTLLEERLRTLNYEVERLKRTTHHNTPQQTKTAAQEKELKVPKALSKANSAYPNLLEKDPFYSKTLPKLVGNTFRPSGIRREALLGRPENLHPFNAFKDVSQIVSMCSGSVATLKFGKFETMAPDLALKLEARPREDKPQLVEYWVHLRDDLFWEPLEPRFFAGDFKLSPWFTKHHPVTAYDFKFFYDAVMNPYVSEPKAVSMRTYYNDLESFEVIDPLTFVVRWRPHLLPQEGEEKLKFSSLNLTGSLQPLASFVYQHFADGEKIVDDHDPETYRNNSIWAQNFAHHWAKNIVPSCGPYIFSGMNDEGITLKRNPNHYQKHAVLVEGVHYKFKESSDAMWQDFKAGTLDLCVLSPNQELEYEQFLSSHQYELQKKEGKAIHSLDFIDRCFYYIGWNFASPLFESAQVRKAMTLAIDRSRIIDQNLGEKAVKITGPLFCQSPNYNQSLEPLPYDPELASHLLDQMGWMDLDGDGIREKEINGKIISFSFRLCYYVKSLASKIIAQYIASALQEIGIECQPYGLDITDLARQFDDKGFDALFMGWKLGSPPSDPRQIWHSSGAKEKGSSNAIGFANKEVDEIIEKLNYEADYKKRKELYHRFHAILHDEAPYTFLYTPKARLLYRERLKNLFIPAERKDLIPDADIPEPSYDVTWLSGENS
jgi:peptide/nickel transport system substrate-binding protein